MEENIKKSYYAIIPANVRYDSELPATARLLYGEITALCNERGYCWATNKYFADLYSASTRSVSRWIGLLESKKYIYTQVSRNDNKQIDKRFISLNKMDIPVDKNVEPYRQKCLGGIDKNVYPPIDKNGAENNTVINNTINNNIGEKRKRFVPPTYEEVKAYCEERKNNVDPQRFIDYYESNGWMVGKNKMKSWKAAVRTWERNNFASDRKQTEPVGTTTGANGVRYSTDNVPKESADFWDQVRRDSQA